MAYIVKIETGKGKNKSNFQSIPLPNKQRVCNYIKRHPAVKSNTEIKVTNTRTRKTLSGKESRFCTKKLF